MKMKSGKIKEKILYFKLKQKDKDAFIEAYDIYVDDVYRFIFFKVGNRTDAEDISSQVFLKAWEYIQNNSLKDYKTLKALFYKIARNLVIDHYRKNSNKNEISIDQPRNEAKDLYIEIKDEKQDVEKNLEVKMSFENIEERLLDLKDEYREVIMLRYINQLSIKEIAGILNKKNGTVRVLVYRAITALKKIK